MVNTRSSAKARPTTFAREKGLVSDKPVAPTPVDIEINRHRGTTVAVEATTERLQASKRAPVPDLAQRIQELTRENGRLRLEIAYHQNMQKNTPDFIEDVKFVVERLEQVVIKFDRMQRVVKDDWEQAMEGVQNA
jgi:hypothetical protein